MIDTQETFQEWSRRVEVQPLLFNTIKSPFFLGARNEQTHWAEYRPGSPPALLLATHQPRADLGFIFGAQAFEGFVKGEKSLSTLRKSGELECVGAARDLLKLDSFFHLLGVSRLHD